MFFVDDIQKEYERLKKLGVKFTMEPTKLGYGFNHRSTWMTPAAISYR